jgi:hypothetical protein
MKLITELVEDVKYITETREDGKKNLYITGPFMVGEQKNRNGRVYSGAVLEKAITPYIENYVEKNRAFGELGHPDGPSINLDRVSHIITELKRDGNVWIGKAKITETPMGNIARGIMESGGTLGVSSRGMGSLAEKNGTMYVKDDYHIATAADIVADPSAPGAFVNGIMEGVEWIWEGNQLVAHQAKNAIERAVVSRDLEEQKLVIFEKFLNVISKSAV